MNWFHGVPTIYLHRAPVDFRKAINGLSVIVEQDMGLSPYDDSVFVFCNRGRDKLKVLHWDKTGFVLWYKRLEEETFKWPLTANNDVMCITPAELDWLLSGLDLLSARPHKVLDYRAVS